MALLPIDDVGSFGLVKDVKPHLLPPEAWSAAENVRFVSNDVHKMLGMEATFGTPGTFPFFLMPVSSATQLFWLYLSRTKAYVYDGSTHTNVTQQTAGADVNYTATKGYDWHGTIFHGLPVFTNYADLPQAWATLATATKLAPLANWPTADRARVIKAFGNHLVALGVKQGSAEYPHMVKWSVAADPGTLPASWVPLTTNDAGSTDLTDVDAGVILDGLPLRGQFFIFKENSVWRMSYIGGTFVFRFDSFLDQAGLLAAKCVAVTGDGLHQFFVTGDDVMVHDGTNAYSVLTNKMRRALFSQIDTTNYKSSFVFCNPAFQEMWFCYPEVGAEVPTRALVFNYGDGPRSGKCSEATVDFVHAAVGSIATASVSWASDPGTLVDGVVSYTWESDAVPWGTQARRKVVLAKANETSGAKSFHILDSGNTRDGVSFPATVQREGLAMMGKTRAGQPIVDYSSYKLVTRLWPKVKGGPVRIRLGYATLVEGAVSWSDYVSFDPATQMWVDIIAHGRAIAVEFSSIGNVWWELSGYQLEIMATGSF